MAKHDHPDGQCPFVEVMEVVGGKWRGTIVFCLADGARRFNELRGEMSQVTQKVLAQELRALERDGLVCRDQHRVLPPKVVYSLTELGVSLIPIVRSIDVWSSAHMKAVHEAQGRYDEARGA